MMLKALTGKEPIVKSTPKLAYIFFCATPNLFLMCKTSAYYIIVQYNTLYTTTDFQKVLNSYVDFQIAMYRSEHIVTLLYTANVFLNIVKKILKNTIVRKCVSFTMVIFLMIFVIYF